MEYFTLSSGMKMPAMGFGTYQIWGKECRDSVRLALDAGYRLIDTAEDYENTTEIAAAICDSGVLRQDLFLTSKVWKIHLHREGVFAACDSMLKILGTDYLDLLLIHHPSKVIPLDETLTAFSELKKSGKIRDFGLSNFGIELCEKVANLGIMLPSVNQIRYSPFWNNEETRCWCDGHGIRVTAHTPIAKGKIFRDPVLTALAEELGRPVNHLVLRWLFEKGMVSIPRSKKMEHIRSNLNIFDFSLPPEYFTAMENFFKEHAVSE
ncbi:MAG: aldo/keto reductase [Spirochaetaceae bacterium]|nr:MAG: aldo/keto reductase [Spirochaetaceae bacterium]